MKVTSERLENSEVMLTIEVENERVEEALRKAARKVSQQTNIPGFRRGKAPYHIVLQTYGRAALLEQAIDDMGPEVYREALDETKIEPYGQAELAEVENDPLVLKMKVPLAPEVDLGDYRALRVEQPAVEVSDEEIDEALEELQEQNVSWLPAERPAEWGDRVTAAIKIDGKEVGAPRDIVLDPESRYPGPGFGEKVLGATSGAELDFELTYPEDWPGEALAGQTRPFHVEVHEVKVKELPELEELPALVGDYEDLEALRESIRQDRLTHKQAEAEHQLIEKALDLLVEQATIQYPEIMVQDEIEATLRRQQSMLSRQGLDMESYLKMLKIDRDDYKEQQRPAAILQLERGLVLSQLAQDEGLKVTTEQIQEEMTEHLAPLTQSAEAYQEMAGFLMSEQGQRHLIMEQITTLARQRVLQIVKGEAPELPAPSDEASTEEPAEAVELEPAAAVEPEPAEAVEPAAQSDEETS